MPIKNPHFGKMVRDARNKRGWKKVEMERQTGLKRGWIAAREKGFIPIERDKLEKLIECLDLPKNVVEITSSTTVQYSPDDQLRRIGDTMEHILTTLQSMAGWIKGLENRLENMEQGLRKRLENVEQGCLVARNREGLQEIIRLVLEAVEERKGGDRS